MMIQIEIQVELLIQRIVQPDVEIMINASLSQTEAESDHLLARSNQCQRCVVFEAADDLAKEFWRQNFQPILGALPHRQIKLVDVVRVSVSDRFAGEMTDAKTIAVEFSLRAP